MSDQEPSAKAMLVQRWDERIMQWIREQSADCRAVLDELWKRRQDPQAFDRLGELFPAEAVEKVRTGIAQLQNELQWNYRTLISMVRIYLTGMSDLPKANSQ